MRLRKLAPARGRADDLAMMIERRHLRSDNPSRALGLLLEAHREQLGVRTLVLSTRRGRVVAGAGHEPEALAAAIAEDDGATAVATWELRAGGRHLVIGSLGGRLSYEVGDGVRRILGT